MFEFSLYVHKRGPNPFNLFIHIDTGKSAIDPAISVFRAYLARNISLPQSREATPITTSRDLFVY